MVCIFSAGHKNPNILCSVNTRIITVSQPVNIAILPFPSHIGYKNMVAKFLLSIPPYANYEGLHGSPPHPPGGGDHNPGVEHLLHHQQ